jgi:hypothetical protein
MTDGSILQPRWWRETTLRRRKNEIRRLYQVLVVIHSIAHRSAPFFNPIIAHQVGIWGVIGHIKNVQNKLLRRLLEKSRPKKTPTGGDALINKNCSKNLDGPISTFQLKVEFLGVKWIVAMSIILLEEQHPLLLNKLVYIEGPRTSMLLNHSYRNLIEWKESADKVFLTCCALHIWLLNEDGLDKDWENGVQSDWEGRLGFHDIQDVEHHIHDAVWRLMTRTPLWRYNISGMDLVTTCVVVKDKTFHFFHQSEGQCSREQNKKRVNAEN